MVSTEPPTLISTILPATLIVAESEAPGTPRGVHMFELLKAPEPPFHVYAILLAFTPRCANKATHNAKPRNKGACLDMLFMQFSGIFEGVRGSAAYRRCQPPPTTIFCDKIPAL